VPSVTGRRLFVLALAVGLAVVLAAALGHSTESERRAQLAVEFGSSSRPVITCDELEAIAEAPILLQSEPDPALLEKSYALDRAVVRIHGDVRLVQPIERSGPSAWTGFLGGLRDAVARGRDESIAVPSLVMPDCNQ
jgi:hypothetical protein